MSYSQIEQISPSNYRKKLTFTSNFIRNNLPSFYPEQIIFCIVIEKLSILLYYRN